MWKILTILCLTFLLVGQCTTCGTSPTDNGWSYQYIDGQLISAQDQAGHVWDWTAEGWVLRHRCRCGVSCPANCTCGCSHTQEQNFGVEREKLGHRERFITNGQEVSKEEALSLIQAEKRLPDDARHLRVTVISSQPQLRQQVLQDFNSPALAPWKDKVVIQDYAPDHWRAKEFLPNDPLTIVISAPNGQVLARQNDYQDGPAGLVKNLQAAQDNYDPSKTPDFRHEYFLSGAISAVKNLFGSEHGTCICFSAGVIVAILIFRKKEKK